MQIFPVTDFHFLSGCVGIAAGRSPPLMVSAVPPVLGPLLPSAAGAVMAKLHLLGLLKVLLAERTPNNHQGYFHTSSSTIA